MINTDLHDNPVKINNSTELDIDFIGTIKHDFKTSVLAQIRILELLLSGCFGKLKFEQSEILKTSLDSCKYMYKILSDIIHAYNVENNDFETILFAQKMDNCLFFIKEFNKK